MAGYFVKDKACSTCSKNCKDCDDSSTCFSCKVGNYLNGKVCDACIANCKTCTESTKCIHIISILFSLIKIEFSLAFSATFSISSTFFTIWIHTISNFDIMKFFCCPEIFTFFYRFFV